MLQVSFKSSPKLGKEFWAEAVAPTWRMLREGTQRSSTGTWSTFSLYLSNQFFTIHCNHCSHQSDHIWCSKLPVCLYCFVSICISNLIKSFLAVHPGFSQLKKKQTLKLIQEDYWIYFSSNNPSEYLQNENTVIPQQSHKSLPLHKSILLRISHSSHTVGCPSGWNWRDKDWENQSNKILKKKKKRTKKYGPIRK